MTSQIDRLFQLICGGRAGRRRLRQRSSGVEQFESRQLLTATLVADLNPGAFSFGPVVSAMSTLNGDLFYVDEIDPSHDSLKRSGAGGTETLYSGHVGELTTVGNHLFFSGEDALAGQELFISDGTASGTRLLKDIDPAGSSAPYHLTSAGNRLFFAVDRSFAQLWTSDGTEAGTRRLLSPSGSFMSIYDITAVGNSVYFSAVHPQYGHELFRSDPTNQFAVLVADIGPATAGSFPDDLVAVGNQLYFTVRSGGGRELWVTDGSAVGTVPVLDGNGNPVATQRGSILVQTPGAEAIALGSDLIFATSSGSVGEQLWKATGSSASLLLDFVQDGGSLVPYTLTTLGDNVYFVADDGVNGQEVWVSDGSELGTEMLMDLNPFGSSGAGYLAASSNLLYFTGYDGLTGRSIWRTDGSTSGAVRLGDMLPGNPVWGTEDPLFVSSGSTMYFQADDVAAYGQLWMTDGAPATTHVVSAPTIYPYDSMPAWLTEFDGKLWFTATNQLYMDDVSALYQTDGTELGTERFFDPALSGLSFVEDPRKINGTLVFTAFDSSFRRQMWTTDGTVGGAIDLTGFAGSGLVQYAEIVEFQDELYFMADDGVHGYELYATDGTSDGTRLVKDINPGSGSSSWGSLGQTAILGDMLYFIARNDTYGAELWRTDGTEAGTQMVCDLVPGSGSSYPWDLAALNGRILFTADDGNDYSLWSTDGTSTEMVVDQFCSNLTVVSGLAGQPGSDVLYFVSDDGVNGAELWRSDGTTLGTSLAMDIRPGVASASIEFMVAGPAGSAALYFIANDGTHGSELWVARSNSVSMLKDINPGSASSWPGSGRVFVAGDLVYLAADDGVHGVEWWQSDGTTEGTQLVDDINFTGLPDGYMGMARVDATVYFSTVGPAGWELYRAPYNHRPSSVSLTGQQVPENSAVGTVVGTLSATDPEAGDTVTFSLVSGSGDADNSFFLIQGSVLKTQATLNYESKNSYSIRVRATDSNGQTRDQVFSISVTNEIELQGLDVQLGQSQRSYVRIVDLLFAGAQDVSDLLNGGWNQFRLLRSTLDNTLPVNVPLSSSMISQSQNAVRFDFGPNGLGGNRNTNAGDGYYELAWDRARNGSFTSRKYFYRLLGDVNGDRRVDSLDASLVTGNLGLANPERDVNGDGIVNVNDRTLVLRALGRRLKDGLFTDD